MLLAQYITVNVTWMNVIYAYGVIHILYGLFTHYKSVIQINRVTKSDEAQIEQIAQKDMEQRRYRFATLEDAIKEARKDVSRGQHNEKVQCKHKIYNAVIAILFLGRMLFGLPFYIGQWTWRLIVLVTCLRNDKSITKWHMTPRDISNYSCSWF